MHKQSVTSKRASPLDPSGVERPVARHRKRYTFERSSRDEMIWTEIVGPLIGYFVRFRIPSIKFSVVWPIQADVYWIVATRN